MRVPVEKRRPATMISSPRSTGLIAAAVMARAGEAGGGRAADGGGEGA